MAFFGAICSPAASCQRFVYRNSEIIWVRYELITETRIGTLQITIGNDYKVDSGTPYFHVPRRFGGDWERSDWVRGTRLYERICLCCRCAIPQEENMKFGKRFRVKISIIMPEWEGECMSYKDLKKQLNLMDPAKRDEGFEQLLKNELEKMYDFFSSTEEEYIIKFQVLKDMVADEDTDTTQMARDLLQFHNKLVLLLQYNVLNCDGFLKIIKKHRKKTGRLISLSHMQGDYQQLFFIRNSLGKLLAECKEILEELVHR